MRLTLVIFSLLYLNWLWASCLIVQSKGIRWRLLQEISSILCRKCLLILFSAPIHSGNLFSLFICYVYSQKQQRIVSQEDEAHLGVKLPLQNLAKSLLLPTVEAQRACVPPWGVLYGQKSHELHLMEHEGICRACLLSGKVLNWHLFVFIVILQVRMTGSHSLMRWFSSWKSTGSLSWFVVLVLCDLSALHGDML